MAPSIQDILMSYQFKPDLLERISERKIPNKVEVCPPDSQWPKDFELLKSRIQVALGSHLLTIAHVGSTSVPGMPAKSVIDIDITVQNPTDEAIYVPPLEAAGFQFLTREPYWHEHRFFCCYEPMANLHVYGPDCPEVLRHRIFRDWLIKNTDDQALYAKVKQEAAKKTLEGSGKLGEYNQRKQAVIREILERAFRAAGYL